MHLIFGCSGYSTVYPAAEEAGFGGEILANRGIEEGCSIRLTLVGGQVLKGEVRKAFQTGLVVVVGEDSGSQERSFEYREIAKIEINDTQEKAGYAVIYAALVAGGLWLLGHSLAGMN